ncbi:NAD+ diphosphatase [Actinokineospora iranica]|uniref:NAD(+) diphosphatase n=2 Tax=Actinokineospora iranica TaxID=1271860 RepID=A0A1G6J0X0_9PSEU|nr:NAD+ diphosphatase [Actinokineospora iranica]
MRERLPYTGMTLDRAGGCRADAAFLARMREHPAARAIVLWRDRCLVRGGAPVAVGVSDDAVFLGVGEERDRADAEHDAARGRPQSTQGGAVAGSGPLFAVDLSELDDAGALAVADADDVVDVRALFPKLSAEASARLAYARGLLHWRRNQRFCGACGSAARESHGGHVRLCVGCGKALFPRIEPAVIVLVESGERCLLGRHRGAAGFSTLAGFVEIGESAEDAVRREVVEETGVVIGDVEYLGSQAWPFPAGLMLGFRAVALTEEIEVDREELVTARWFTRSEVAELDRGRGDSIEAFLVDTWMANGRR